MQMYGLHFYGITEKHNTEKHWKMEKYGALCDMNDFLHDNSPYLANYVRPLLMGTPEVTSESSPSKEAATEHPIEHPETVGNQGGSMLGVDEFGSNDALVRGGFFGLTTEDFRKQHCPDEETPGAGDDKADNVPHSNSPEQMRKFNGKEIVMESGDVLLDLSDMSDSYSDMQNPPFDEVEVDQEGTSGAMGPLDDQQAGPSLTSTVPPTPGTHRPVVVKQERTGFWEQREKERTKKQRQDEAERARVRAMEEELALLQRENTSLRSQSQISAASHDTMSDAQIVRPPPADPILQSSPTSKPHEDLQVEDSLSGNTTAPVYEDCPSTPLKTSSSSQDGDVHSGGAVQPSSPLIQKESSQVQELDLRLEDRVADLTCKRSQDESLSETEVPGTTEAAPPTTEASPICNSQIRSTRGEMEEELDYGDGLDDSDDVQVLKVQGNLALGVQHESIDQTEKVYSRYSSDPYEL